MWKFLAQLAIIAALVSPSFAANLFCTFAGSPQQCNIVNISNVASANEAITVVGQPSTYVDTVTTYISFQAMSKFDYFPTNIFTIFPNLNSISMYNSSFTNFVSNAFANCGKLSNINGGYLSFTNIPASIGPTCVNLTSIYMGQGLLTTIDVNAFKGMKLLQNVGFSNNKITCIPPGLFANNPVIQMVDFSYNQITAVDPMTFTGLLNLMNIMLQNNQISFVPAMNFTHTGWTQSLYIAFDSNPVTAIHPEFLSNVFLSRNSMMGQTSVGFNQMAPNSQSTCIQQQQYSWIASYNWVAANASMDVCYANWTPAMENYQVSCAPPKTTTTTTVSSIITTLAGNPSATTPSGSSGSNTGCQCGASGSGGQCPCQQSAYQLIFNQVRNLTMNLGFN